MRSGTITIKWSETEDYTTDEFLMEGDNLSHWEAQGILTNVLLHNLKHHLWENEDANTTTSNSEATGSSSDNT